MTKRACTRYAVALATLAIFSIALARELRAQQQVDSLAMLQCYSVARDQTLLDSSDAQTLCRGTSSLGPVECYMQGDRETFLDTIDLLRLCRCADSAEPVGCYVQARTNTDLWKLDALTFCSPIFVHHLWLDCTPRER